MMIFTYCIIFNIVVVGIVYHIYGDNEELFHYRDVALFYSALVSVSLCVILNAVVNVL